MSDQGPAGVHQVEAALAGRPGKGTHNRRRKTAVVAAILGAIVVYIGVLVFYYDTVTPPEDPTQSYPNSLNVELRPQTVDPDDQSLSGLLEVTPPKDLVDKTGRLKEDLEIFFPLSNQSFYFQAKSRVLRQDATFSFPDNTYERYPFDSHTLPLASLGYIVNDRDRENRIPTVLQVWGDVSGWQLNDPREVPTWLRDQMKERGDLEKTGLAYLRMNRAGSTVAIVGVVMLALVIIVVFAFFVVRATATQHRYADIALAGWFATLLFAVFPLRLNLPGAPPIGAWLDYIVFLWVVIGLLTALGFFIWTWLRYGDPPRQFWKQIENSDPVK